MYLGHLDLEMRPRFPAQDPLGFCEIVLYLVFVAGDEERLERSVSDLHELGGGHVGVRQVLFVGD